MLPKINRFVRSLSANDRQQVHGDDTRIEGSLVDVSSSLNDPAVAHICANVVAASAKVF